MQNRLMFKKINNVAKKLKKKLMLKYKKKYHKSKYCLEGINRSNMLNKKKINIIMSNLYSFHLSK